MSVGETIEQATDATADTFQSLSLSIPIETTRFTFICLFITRVLNLKDENKIISEPNSITTLQNKSTSSVSTNNTNSKNNSQQKKKRPIEILPGIAIPKDLWLKDEIIIKDIKIKISMLHEINSMLQKEIDSVQSYDKAIDLDLTTLSYYEKLLNAYKFLEISKRDIFPIHYKKSTMDLSFKEDDDILEEDGLEENDQIDETNLENNNDHKLNSFSRTSISNPNVSPTNTLNYATSPIANRDNNNNSYQLTQTMTNSTVATATTTKRISALSRDIMSSRKRFLTLLSHNNTANNGSPPMGLDAPSDISPSNMNFIDEDNKKQQALNSLLAKSKLYNKIKRHRELSTSTNSTTSNHSSFLYSNRNSISTTNTSNSTNSRRRASSNVTTPDFNDRLLLQPIRIPAISFTSLNNKQKQENQKLKLNYYMELNNLNKLTSLILSILNKSIQSHNLIKLIEFIKNFVFKFIIIDVSQMIIDYGYFKAYDSFRN